MIDFTSSLYLGMRHAHASLAPWKALTYGVPAALREPVIARDVASALANLQGCEAAVLGTSTLHLFWDAFGMIRSDVTLLVDDGLYPVGRAGVERAGARGARTRVVPHYNFLMLSQAVADCARKGRRPILVCDGLCVDCGRVAPLAQAVPLLEAHRGHAIVDDTQALGVVGGERSAARPLGSGGGGSLRHQGARASNVILIASLAKAFGVPVAVLSGRRRLLAQYTARSEVRVHSSPPSVAHLAAAAEALRLNEHFGERLRARLRASTFAFRHRAARAGVRLTHTLLPVQTVDAPVDGVALHKTLLARGIATVLRARSKHGSTRVSFVITARHTEGQIDEAVGHLAHALSVLSTAMQEDDDHVDHSRWIYSDDAAFPRSPYASAVATTD